MSPELSFWKWLWRGIIRMTVRGKIEDKTEVYGGSG
jgi:hypothetical protein